MSSGFLKTVAKTLRHKTRTARMRWDLLTHFVFKFSELTFLPSLGFISTSLHFTTETELKKNCSFLHWTVLWTTGAPFFRRVLGAPVNDVVFRWPKSKWVLGSVSRWSGGCDLWGKMFRWRSERHRVKAIFKLHFHVTQVASWK